MVECIDYDPGEYSDVWETGTWTARKVHTCCECQRPIAPGQSYQRTKSLSEGQWDEWKTCLDCVAVGEALYGGGPWPAENLWGNIWESFSYDEMGHELPVGALLGLSDWAQRQLAEIWDEVAESYGWLED
jgi:hypothetical protein